MRTAASPGWFHTQSRNTSTRWHSVQLREDPPLGVLSGKPQPGAEPLAGKHTLNRFELGSTRPSRYKKIHYQPEAIDELTF